MSVSIKKELAHFMDGLRKRNPHEEEFHQSVEEVAESVFPWYLDHKQYRDAQILERVTEPDRVIIFRVTWEMDDGTIRANRAWRVQFNHSLGPYKGGLRFDPSVTLSVLKFLGFEQIFKNSLTGLPMGGGKGGANFNPKGKTDREVMRFCQSMMTELHRHIGEDVDVPAGDIGVGAREISYLFGQYMRLENRWSGVMTGKGASFGGSAIRTEATGYGCVYFCEHMLNEHGEDLEGKTVAISGSGNVALYAAQKAMQKGAKVITLSDSSGFVHAPEGLNPEQWEFARVLKEQRRGRLSEMAEQFRDISHHTGIRPWQVPCQVAMPCATQNEIDESDADQLIRQGVIAVCEGANMPATVPAVHLLRDKKILHAPGKASNAGGVAVSGLEQTQNAMRISWSREEVDERLQKIMRQIHQRCVAHGKVNGRIDYVVGANIGGFQKVAEAMLAYGVL
ncbi:NADP-specific glutamate dehydrogenase [Roseimaritima multifibrata]|uniref:Glutamate dehydrogenase n=1 Tax=Roseimaritima multifibrata TaxID=1930274 RepID=A0A517MGW4_9BACT|nr:NADP-specific glutamate dehydrogenase [Roseimaritima multifibrata]QDS94119.1 NADP-specific glutamate dehydrogenase [Roseimaritima multifibrata]